MNHKLPWQNSIKTKLQTALELAFGKAFESHKCNHVPEFVITHPDGKKHKCMKCGEWYK